MNPKVRNALLIFGPLAVGVGVIWWVNHKPKEKNTVGTPDDDGVAPVQLASTTTNTSTYFPLKKGSRNSKVTELQKLIGTMPDGIFGPATEAALFALSGSTVVANQADFDNIKKLAQGISNKARAQDLLAKFKASSTLRIMFTKAIISNQVIQDAFGALNPTGKAVKITANLPLSRQDYQLTDTTKSGNLLMKVDKGDNMGLYSVDPVTITLV